MKKKSNTFYDLCEYTNDIILLNKISHEGKIKGYVYVITITKFKHYISGILKMLKILTAVVRRWT